MHEACQEGHTDVAKILLENAQNNHPELIQKMCKDEDDDGATPLLLGKAFEVYSSDIRELKNSSHFQPFIWDQMLMAQNKNVRSLNFDLKDS